MRAHRAASDDLTILSPLQILEIAKAAYDRPFILESDRLQHSAFVCVSYLGGFRIGETMGLKAGQFKRKRSMLKREFIVIEKVQIEKSPEGRMRNCPIPPTDPLSVPVTARLAELEPHELLFSFTQRTGRNIIDHASGGAAWPHWLRAQRDRFLAEAFGKPERMVILGWSRGNLVGGKSKPFRHHDAEDFYASLNWMTYADKLGSLTDTYWDTEPLPAPIKSWLDSLTATVAAQEKALIAA